MDKSHVSPTPDITSSDLTSELALPAPSIIKVFSFLVDEALARGASDIHIDPTKDTVRIRMRIDGVLSDTTPLPKTIHQEVISRIKILSSLRTDEHQAAQDGRFRYTHPVSGDLDVRVSIAPTYYGENAVLRLLVCHAKDQNLSSLGFSDRDVKTIEEAIKSPHGMILSTGPTGSGKTTTLYALIGKLNLPSVAIITIEDPIEYSIDGIEQIQVNPRTGLTFAQGLRSLLRQDPDIIMVGEIRDSETANIAVNTALTGHLLLSTLHTNDAATTLPRLLDMGADPYLIASTMNVAIAQRLVRKLCATCKKEMIVSDALVASLASQKAVTPFTVGEKVYTSSGCNACKGTGYGGRISINEVLRASPAIKEAILRRASASEIKSLATAEGMTTMLDDGFAKVRKGITSIEEVLRVTHE